MKQKILSILLLCTLFIGAAYAQNKSVSGKVTDELGAALQNVTVVAEGTTSATQTDNYGNFRINAKEGSKLTFRLIGFTEQTISVGSSAIYTIQLESSIEGLDEVVVVGYGTQNKEAIVGAVASVSAKDIEKRPVSSVTAVLEGAAPGLQINNSYGEPGSSPNIRVRGYGSINGSSTPTYVVDGVVYNGNISDINPTDVESVSVLKDATSAALYGNRAANGVIVITTKKGRRGTAEISLNINQGLFSRGIGEYETLDPQQYMEAAWLGYRNQLMSQNPTWTQQQANDLTTSTLVPTILKTNIFTLPEDQLFDGNGKLLSNATIHPDYASDLDWFGPISRNGYRQDYQIGGRGGSEKGNFYFNLGYLSEEGYIKTSDFDRLSGRINAEVTPRSWIKAGFSANASHQLGNNTTGTGSGFTNPWLFARNIAPIYPIHQHDPITGEYLLDAQGNKMYDDGTNSRNQYLGRHVIWENELNMNKNKRNTIASQSYVDVNFLDNFTFSLLGDINLIYDENAVYNNALIGDGQGNNGRANRTIYNRKIYSLQQQLKYNNTFNGVHNVDVFVGHENYGNIYTYLYGFKNNETFAGKTDLINFTEITNLTESEYNDKSESYLSRLRYNYSEKYFVEGSFRRDGSSRLHPKNRWGNFWSIGGTWMASKESFLSDVSWLNTLKLRAATGVVGNLGSLGFFDYMALYAIGQNNNIAALYKSNNQNEDLKWEGSQSTSLAIEGKIFNRVNFTVEYFDKRSKDLIFNVNLPLSTGPTDNTVGYASIKKNIGDLVNKGLEVHVDADIIKNQDFTWNFGVNATFLKNKIVNLPEENKANGIISAPFKYMEGHSVYDYYLFQYAGVDMMTGQALYHANTDDYDPTAATGDWLPFQEEINGEMYTRNSTYAKREFSGSGIARVMGSLTTNLDYKNWSLSGLFTYSLGGKGLDYSYVSLMGVTTTPSAVHKDVLNSWNGIPEGMTETSENRINPNATPQINYTNSQYNNASTTTRFLMDNSYFVVRNVALAYRLPQNVAERIGLNRISCIASVENLASFTGLKGYSPQQTFGGYSENAFVPARTFSLGINVGF
ncbi:SusC/RagA family TonB-linked outer membrane protein [Sphingobacterium hungaricum]|uniref:SusC/RagA family TonB-linked outer membrane protein n=1 Tax=Sphingobacterium hungaricum TaxID=2082723 RepID=A0A928UXG0_9SPHI|nr:SusC/RagA family TonB-linked outer membrane protein [Sphingobacterium hungaricum]MBE8713135.1 SusC/RagA family TonB-linked outer membrane protein [Sphingobacterium hungaricum]